MLSILIHLEEKMANDYLLKTWREIAYNQEQTQEQYNQFWGAYFVQEKEVYKDILGHPDVVVKGTVEELAKKYAMPVDRTFKGKIKRKIKNIIKNIGGGIT